MTVPGTIRENELWLRCPFCHDSEKNQNTCHFSVNLCKGVFHCLRCKESGRLSPAQQLDLMFRVDADSTTHLSTNQSLTPAQVAQCLTEGPASTRKSRLDRYHLVMGEQHYDAFLVKDPFDGDTTGFLLRAVSKRVTPKSLMVGESGFSWPGQGQPLCSSPSTPIRLVEGPYDTLYPEDVSVNGLITTQCLKLLKGHSVILCPDGDVWKKPDLFRKFCFLMYRLSMDVSSIDLVAIEVIPDGKDPDEVPVTGRYQLSRKDLPRFLKSHPISTITPRRAPEYANYLRY